MTMLPRENSAVDHVITLCLLLPRAPILDSVESYTPEDLIPDALLFPLIPKAIYYMYKNSIVMFKNHP